jgi:hypothetical protein
LEHARHRRCGMGFYLGVNDERSLRLVLGYETKDGTKIEIFEMKMALVTILVPSILVFKILPNIFAAGLVFVVYLISKKLTNSIPISLFSAFVSGFIPSFVAQTVNTISAYTLAIPLMFLMIYFIMNMSEMKYVKYFALLIFILPFHDSVRTVITKPLNNGSSHVPDKKASKL